MKFSIILQNRASKVEYLLTGLTNSSQNILAYVFEDFEMPEGAEYGEYTGILFIDNRYDSVYDLKDDVLSSTVSTAEGTVEVRHLRPEVFILKYASDGEDGSAVVFVEKDTNYYYYER